jgi:hypothetical protein
MVVVSERPSYIIIVLGFWSFSTILMAISILWHLGSPVQLPPPPLSCAEPLVDLAIPTNAVNFAVVDYVKG